MTTLTKPHAEQRIAFSVREAAAVVGVAYVSLYGAIKRGELKAHKVGQRKTLVLRSDLVKWIESHGAA